MTYRQYKDKLQLFVQLVVLASVFLSCRKDSSLGVDVLDGDHRLVNQTMDTFSLRTYSEFADPVVTFDTTFAIRMFGTYLDPDFGQASSDLYFRLFLESGTNIVDFSNVSAVNVDSVIMSFSLRGKYGVSDQLAFNVYELSEEILANDYYSDEGINYYPNNVGSGTILAPNSTDSVTVGTSKEPAQLRLPLSKSFGYSLLQRATGVDNTVFPNLFKGLAIIPDSSKNQLNGTGAVLSLDMISNFTKLTVYYEQGGNKKSYSFRPATTSYYFNKFYHNYQNSTIFPTLLDSTLGQDWMYIQSLAGVNGRINAPHLKNLLNDSKNIAIQKAELKLQIKIDDIFDYPANSALILRERSTGSWLNLKDLYIEGSGHYGGLLDGATYSFNITRYVQDLMKNWQEDGDAIFDLQVIPDGEGKWDAKRSKVGGYNNGAQLILNYTAIN